MIRIHSMNNNDKKQSYGSITENRSIDSSVIVDSVTSDNIFGREHTNMVTRKVSTETYHRTGIIEFPIPIINPILAGTANTRVTLRKVLPHNFYFKDKKIEITSFIDNRSLVQQVLDRSIVFDTDNAEFISRNKLEVSAMYYNQETGKPRYLFGGSLVRTILDCMNIEEEIRSLLLYNFVYPAYRKSIERINKDDIELYAEINYGNGDIRLLDDYYVVFKNNIDVSCKELFAKVFWENVYSNYAEKSTNSKLTYFLRMKENIELLNNAKGIMQDYMRVLPIGYRPKFQGKEDPLTIAYDNVVAKNNNLISMLKSKNRKLSDVMNSYANLDNSVREVLYQSPIMNGKEKYKSIRDRIIGKTGAIRDKMQKSIVDGTSRSVIIPDPELSINSVGIPKKMIVKLMELNMYDNDDLHDHKGNKKLLSNYSMEELIKKSIPLAENEYIMNGRQPTLYRHGIQSFRIVPVDGFAIRVPLLSTQAFNADFDGDQMHQGIANYIKAKEELRLLIGNTKNPYTIINGSVHMYPRHEIIYGLWYASQQRPTGRTVSKYPIFMNKTAQLELYNKVNSNEWKLNDIIEWGDKTVSVGFLYVKCSMGSDGFRYIHGDMSLSVMPTDGEEPTYKPVTDKYYIAILGKLYTEDKGEDKFIKAIDNLTKFGLSIAYLYPLTINICNVPYITDIVSEFTARVDKHREYLDMGLSTEESFQIIYSNLYNEMYNKIKDSVVSQLGVEDGYVQMVNSHCRGSMSNVIQMFGIKGRVMKNSNQSFDTVITNNIISGLSDLEYFLAAYGGRQGQMDKTLETSTPGYLSRMLKHTANEVVITNFDCGTENGLLLTYDYLQNFINVQSNATDIMINEKCRKIFCKIVKGRFLVGFDDMQENEEEILAIYDKYVAKVENHTIVKLNGIKLRSILYCENPYCIKCYGKDISKNSLPNIGTPLGFLSAPAIGEVGSQTTMRNFQGGGVQRSSNITSSFGFLNRCFELTSFNIEAEKTGAPITTDYISPSDGYVKCQELGNGTKLLHIIDESGNSVLPNRKQVILDSTTKTKEYVHKGEGISKDRLQYDIVQYIKELGTEAGRNYLLSTLYASFADSAEVNLKHFETILTGMTFYVCLQGNDYFKTGLRYTHIQYHKHNREGCKFKMILVSVKSVPNSKVNCMSGVLFEDFCRTVSEALILNNTDDLSEPYTQLSLGLHVKVGTGFDGNNYSI